jgi:hypothetical protein
MKQTPPTDRLQINVPGMVAAVVGFGLAVVYLTTALAAQDGLWFLKGFAAEPDRIIIYHGGTRTELRPGEPAFAALARAVRESLAHGASRPSIVGFSEGSLQDAYNLYVTLEAFFDQPVKFHAGFNTGRPTQMLFPLTGRHAELNIVLLGRDGVYWASPPVLNNLEPLRETLKALGYLQPSGESP